MVSKLPNFNENFELKGYWWLPNNPEKKIPGIFKYSAEKTELSLMGSFMELTEMGKPKDYKIILGATPQGDLLTLHNGFQNSYTISAPGYPTETIFIIESYIGFHFTNPDDINFKNVKLNLTNFEEWVGLSGFKTDFSELEKSNKISIHYTLPNEIKCKINDQLQLIIEFGYTLSSTSDSKKSEGIVQNTTVRIESEDEIPFKTFKKSINDLKNFLSLAILEPVYELEIFGQTNKNEQTLQQIKIQNPIKIYYPVFNMPINIKKIFSMHMLFTYRDIADKFESYYQNWIANKEILQPIYNLYFGIIYNKYMYLDQKFLGLIQAVESFHRRTSNETDLSREEHEQRIEKILDSTPQEYRKWLKWNLLYSNEITLRKRLDILLEQFPHVIDDYSLSKEEFIDLVVTTRNYLTHYNEELKSKAADTNKQQELYLRLMLLVESCLLSQLGFEKNKIIDLMNQSKRRKGIKNS